MNISIRGLERVAKYEKTRKSNKRIVMECIEAMDKAIGEKKIGGWEERRRRTLKWAGIKKEELKKRREEGELQ